MQRPAKTYDDVRHAFDRGTVLDASKTELEDYLLAVGRAQILSEENRSRAREMGETLRQLLAARQSQEFHTQAMRISKIALIVAVIALLASAGQLAVSLYPNWSKKAQPGDQHNAGDRPPTNDSPASDAPSSPAPRG
jgi:cytochrome c-type biogenesis protein CcmH/NrfG